MCLAKRKPSVGSSQPKLESGPDSTNILRLDGLDIVFDASGKWDKIYSTYTQPVDVPDRRGIKKAQVIAEEKGKAQIVRFLNQEVSSERLVDEVDTTLQTAVHETGSEKEHLAKSTQRVMSESVREFTRSFSRGTISGLTILGEGYNSTAEEAWVKVGFSRATMRIAEGIRQGNATPSGKTSNPIPAKDSPEQIKQQPSENRGERDIPPGSIPPGS